jgi:hypothetical protein
VIHRHRWSKWECVPVVVSGIFMKQPQQATGQRRQCDKCGKVELRTL